MPDLRSRISATAAIKIPNGKPPLTQAGFVDALEAVCFHWNLGSPYTKGSNKERFVGLSENFVFNFWALQKYYAVRTLVWIRQRCTNDCKRAVAINKRL